MSDAPNNGDRERSANGANGAKRDGSGRFVRGTAPGPGNPFMAQLSAWRSALANAVTAEDLAEVLAVLVRKAKAGERWAVRELLDRTLGRPRQPLDVTGIERGGIDESLRIARDLPLSANAAAAAEELAAAIVEAQRAAVGPAAQAAAGSDDG